MYMYNKGITVKSQAVLMDTVVLVLLALLNENGCNKSLMCSRIVIVT